MPAHSIRSEKRIEFIKKFMRKKVNSTGLSDTPACQTLAETINLSHATLLKALKGEFTLRSVRMMVSAGWFTYDEYTDNSSGNTNTKTRRSKNTNDNKQQKARERAAFQRGFEHGKQRAQSDQRVAAFARGYDEGLRDGQAINKMPLSPKGPSGLPMDRLQSLFNMTASNGAAHGETVAARKAVGKALAKWVKEKFNQDVEIQVT